MEQAIAVDTTLTEILGCVLASSERSLESLLEARVDGFVALRELGTDEREGHPKIRLFIYDYLPLKNFQDDIKVRPNHYCASSEVAMQMKHLMYDRYYVKVGTELYQVSGDVFKCMLFQVVVNFVDVDTTDYFYL
jgi:hypothetical protein